jgi:hypothetical protein
VPSAGSNPDEEVQARLQLVFTKLAELQNVRGVMRYLRANDPPLPVHPLRGPVPHEVLWREADSAQVRHILQNPACRGLRLWPPAGRSGAAAQRRTLGDDQGRPW